MSYLTIQDLPERQLAELVGSDNILLSDANTSGRVTLDTLNAKLFQIGGSAYQTLTNEVIDSVTNFVHANAIHFSAMSTQPISKGTPVKLVSVANPGSDIVYVDVAVNNDTVVGICEDGLVANVLGEVMVTGILNLYDTSSWNETDILYYQNGIVTATPDTLLPFQMIGFVFNSDAVNGKILITNKSLNSSAVNTSYNNTTTGLAGSNVQTAITEVDNNITTVDNRVTALETQNASGTIDGGVW